MTSILHKNHASAKFIQYLGIAATVALVSLNSLSAATLAEYGFATVFTSSDTEPNSTASLFGGASGFAPNGSGLGGGGNFFVRSSVTTDNQSGAIAGNDYASFTVTIGTGFQTNLTNLTFEHSASVGGSSEFSENFTSNIQIWSSLNNFASSLGSSSLTKAGATTGNTNGTVNIDLSAYAGITGDIEFRIYVFDDTTRNDDFTRLDNVKLNGDTSMIPEPSGLLLASLGLLASFRRRR